VKIESYKEYSKIFDLTSSHFLFPLNMEFISEISTYCFIGQKIADVGGGTGFFSAKLLERCPGVKLSFIEPCDEMMRIAKLRLTNKVIYFQDKFEGIIDKIENQDIFIFQRSLYSFYDNLDDYKKLANRIYEKTNSDGHIAILEVKEKYDVKEIKEYLEYNKFRLRLKDHEFSAMWEVFEKVLKEFNENVEKGIFTLLSEKQVLEIFSNFSLIFSKDNMFVLKKQA
jgi:ubiquinone/menaquinone biosynthesis C-methylase UbiE